MHVLTKIFVVFASFLSVLLVALTVAYASNAGELVQELDGLESHSESLAAQLALNNADRNKELGKLEVERDQYSELLREREQEILDLKNQLTELAGSQAIVELKNEQLTAQITQLVSSDTTKTELLSKLTDEVNRRREEGLALERRNIELQDEINDLGSQLEVARAHERKLEEDLRECQRQLAGEGTDTEGDTIPPMPVFGRIISVERTSTGQVYVEVNLGSSDQLREGHELRIVRGDQQYVGSITLQRVDVNSSVGLVERVVRGMEVQENDRVQSPIGR